MAESLSNENESSCQYEKREIVFPKDSIDIVNQMERALESSLPFVVKKLTETVEKAMNDGIARMIREEVAVAVKEEFKKRDDQEHLYRRRLKKSLKEKINLQQMEAFSMLVDVARDHEVEQTQLDKEGSKRRIEEANSPSKRTRHDGGLSKSVAKKDIPSCKICKRNHLGVCRAMTKGCCKCGKMGHIS